MKSIAVLLSLLITSNLFGQEVKTKIEDFNKDGSVDTMQWYYDGGSGFGGWYCSTVNGKTKERIEMSSWGCFCDIQRTVLIPPALRRDENKVFLDQMKSVLLPERYEKPDPSLQWILSAYAANNKPAETSNFCLLIHPSLNWVNGDIQMPKNYYIDLKGAALHQIYSTDGSRPEWYDAEKNEGWLCYYGLTHGRMRSRDTLILLDSTATRQIYKTAHGLILKKGDSYSWIFVTDHTLTGGPDKLRWESIQKIEVVGDHLILQQSRVTSFLNALFIIDLRNGSCGKLKVGIEKFNIENNTLIYQDFEEKGSFSLPEIFSELETERITFHKKD